MARFLLLLTLPFFAIGWPALAQQPWQRHVIDDSFRGADGVRLADFNGDSLQDIVTGWEQSGVVRLYLNPGKDRVAEKWPAVTVGKAGSPEDAVPFDFDGDGVLDVVSCHEGNTRQVLVHRTTTDNKGASLKSNDWSSTAFGQVEGKMWMFAEPIALGRDHRGLVIGSKGNDASITLLIAPSENAADPSRWSAHKLRDAGWIMTLKSLDMDGDGDQDVFFSDRKGEKRGIGWLEQPNGSSMQPWTAHELGGSDFEAMFVDATPKEILVSTRNSFSVEFSRHEGKWNISKFPNPDGVPFGKAIKRLSNDSLVFTANTAVNKDNNSPGIWLRTANQMWHPIDTTTAVKPDRLECLDLDGDGDLDVMTCEERKNLGVIWYENPER